MSYPMSLSMMFESVGLFHGLLLPVVVLGMFILLALPAVFRPSARAEAITLAAYCYLAQMLGVMLMTAGSLPALYAVFAQRPLTETTYIGLLIVFGIGGLIFLWHDSHLHKIDLASRAIPGALFAMTWKFIGLLVTVFAGLSLILRLMLVNEQTGDWWVTNLIMLVYGMVLCWFTLHRHHPDAVLGTPVRPRPAPARPVAVPIKTAPAQAVRKPGTLKMKPKK
jgi:hypothetical protein